MVATNADANVIIDTPPAEIRTSTPFTAVITSATPPTTGNTTATLGGASLGAATSVTGSNPYTVTFNPTSAVVKKYDTTGYPLIVTVDVDSSAPTANIPYLPPTGWEYIDAVNPEIIETWSMFVPYTGPDPVTGFQLVYETPATGTTVVYPNGDISVTPKPTSSLSIPRYFVNNAGEIGAQADYILEIDSIPVDYKIMTTPSTIQAPELYGPHSFWYENRGLSSSTVTSFDFSVQFSAPFGVGDLMWARLSNGWFTLRFISTTQVEIA